VVLLKSKKADLSISHGSTIPPVGLPNAEPLFAWAKQAYPFGFALLAPPQPIASKVQVRRGGPLRLGVFLWKRFRLLVLSRFIPENRIPLFCEAL